MTLWPGGAAGFYPRGTEDTEERHTKRVSLARDEMPKCVGGLLPCALLCVIRVLCGSIVLQRSRPAGGPSSVCSSPVSPCLGGRFKTSVPILPPDLCMR